MSLIRSGYLPQLLFVSLSFANVPFFHLQPYLLHCKIFPPFYCCFMLYLVYFCKSFLFAQISSHLHIFEFLLIIHLSGKFDSLQHHLITWNVISYDQDCHFSYILAQWNSTTYRFCHSSTVFSNMSLMIRILLVFILNLSFSSIVKMMPDLFLSIV